MKFSTSPVLVHTGGQLFTCHLRKVFIVLSIGWVFILPAQEVFAQYEPKNIDEQEILTTFANYMGGFEQFKAETILKNITSASAAYFDTLLHFSHYADSATLIELPVSQLIMVLNLRKKLRDQLPGVQDAKGLLHAMLHNGIIREDLELQIVDIHMKDSVAHCAAIMPGMTSAKDYIFVKENDYWKLDLYSQFRESDRNFSDLLANEALLKQYQLSREQLYRQIFDKLGIPAGSSPLWQPLKSGKH